MDKIEKIIYINLDHRTDRQKDIEKEFEKLKIPKEKIIRFSAIKHQKGVTGCILSHIAVMKMAKEMKLSNVLILEDDFNFVDNVKHIEDSLNLFFNTINEWDVLKISNVNKTIIRKNELLPNKILQAKSALSTSANLINNHIYYILINLLEKNPKHYPIDNSYRDYMNKKTQKWFYFNSPLGYQRPSFSDILGHKVQYARFQ